MADKRLIWLGAGIGGIIGAYVPVLWGDTNMLSLMSIFLSGVGGVVGIILAYRISRNFG